MVCRRHWYCRLIYCRTAVFWALPRNCEETGYQISALDWMAWMTSEGKKRQLPCTGVVPKEKPISKLLFPPITIATSSLLAVPLLVRAFLLFQIASFMHPLHYEGNASSLGARFFADIFCVVWKRNTLKDLCYICCPVTKSIPMAKRKRIEFLLMY